MDTFVLVLILGIVLGIIVSILPFVDFLSVLIKIFPANVPSDLEEHKNFVSSNSYQIHKSKWKKIFILVSIVYSIVYCVITILFDNILLGFYGALVVSVVYFGITSNIEYKQRKLLISKIRKQRQSDNTGDGSMIDEDSSLS